MGYEVILNDRYVVGTLGPDNKVTYDETNKVVHPLVCARGNF